MFDFESCRMRSGFAERGCLQWCFFEMETSDASWDAVLEALSALF